MRLTLFLGFVLLVCSSYGPPNCNLYEGDEACYKACKEAEAAITFPQGSKPSQEHFDASIALCPSFDYSYQLHIFTAPFPIFTHANRCISEYLRGRMVGLPGPTVGLVVGKVTGFARVEDLWV